MKYFLDTEFIEHAGGIDIISLGMVSEEGKTLYLESSIFDESKADDWVKKNVINKLHFHSRSTFVHLDEGIGHLHNSRRTFVHLDEGMGHLPSWQFAEWILRYIGEDEQPQFYAYYADYDWVVFCRLFGRMINLPKHFPMFCMDLKQMMEERGLDKEWKRQHCPDPEGEHDALVDALWNQQLYRAITEIPLNPPL